MGRTRTVKKKIKSLWEKIRRDFPATSDLSEKEHQEIINLLVTKIVKKVRWISSSKSKS
jgi:hypothetical protein